MASDASSLRMTPVAEAVPMIAPVLGFDSVTEKDSLDSTAVSPATSTVTTLELSPAAKFTTPEGSSPPVKSAPFTPSPPTAQLALAPPLRSPVRVTVKVKEVLPDWPSALSVLVAAIESDAGVTSSLRMTPVAVPSRIDAPSEALDKVTVKLSSSSTAVSPMTATRMVCCVTPAAKVRVPLCAT